MLEQISMFDYSLAGVEDEVLAFLNGLPMNEEVYREFNKKDCKFIKHNYLNKDEESKVLYEFENEDYHEAFSDFETFYHFVREIIS
ncbi:MAG: hypothetical protein ACI35O_14495 [Bacillaceae bacterium]